MLVDRMFPDFGIFLGSSTSRSLVVFFFDVDRGTRTRCIVCFSFISPVVLSVIVVLIIEMVT